VKTSLPALDNNTVPFKLTIIKSGLFIVTQETGWRQHCQILKPV